MADFPKAFQPARDEPAFFDRGQMDNFVNGAMRSKFGVQQFVAEAEEAIGLEPPGHAAFVTEQLKKKEELLRTQTEHAANLKGAKGVEFVGEIAKDLLIPFGQTKLAAGLFGALAGSTYFNDQAFSDRFIPASLGAAIGAGTRALIPGKGVAQDELKNTLHNIEGGTPNGSFGSKLAPDTVGPATARHDAFRFGVDDITRAGGTGPKSKETQFLLDNFGQPVREAPQEQKLLTGPSNSTVPEGQRLLTGPADRKLLTGPEGQKLLEPPPLTRAVDNPAGRLANRIIPGPRKTPPTELPTRLMKETVLSKLGKALSATSKQIAALKKLTKHPDPAVAAKAAEQMAKLESKNTAVTAMGRSLVKSMEDDAVDATVANAVAKNVEPVDPKMTKGQLAKEIVTLDPSVRIHSKMKKAELQDLLKTTREKNVPEQIANDAQVSARAEDNLATAAPAFDRAAGLKELERLVAEPTSDRFSATLKELERLGAEPAFDRAAALKEIERLGVTPGSTLKELATDPKLGPEAFAYVKQKALNIRKAIDEGGANAQKPLGERIGGGKQGGFINTDVGALATGAIVGGGLGGYITGDPLGALAGAIAGAPGARIAARRLDKVTTNAERAGMRKASEAGQAFVSKVNRETKLRQVGKEAIADTLGAGRSILDSFLGSTITRIAQITPRVAVGLREMEFLQHTRSQELMDKSDKLFDRMGFDKMTDQQIRRHKIATLNSTKNGAAYLRSIGNKDGAKAMEEFDQLMQDTGRYLDGVGLGSGLRKNYMPRQVTDTSFFERIDGVDTYFAQLRKKKKVNLTNFQKEQEITDLMNTAVTRGNEKTSYARAAANLKKRTVKVTNANVDAYADLRQGMMNYAESVTNQAERRRFFKGQNVNVDKFGPQAENVEGIAVKLKDELKKNGDLTDQQLDEVTQLIRMRFGPGEQASSRAVQNFKNLTYTGLLANPIAAATQLGDLALSAYKNGIRNTASSVIEQLMSPKNPLASGLDKKTLLGISDATAEFDSKVGTRDLVNWGLAHSGFSKIDRLGKNTFINAAMRKNKQLSEGEFMSKWGDTFDPTDTTGAMPQTRALYKQVQDFQKIDGSNKDTIGFMLWNELSDVQPISLSSLPEQYLKNPNGRMMYMLQSFTLKLFDVMKRDIINEAKAGNKIKAAKNATRLTGLFVAMNSTVDGAKNFILGRDNSAVSVVGNNFLKMLGVNKFTIDLAGQDGIGTAIKRTLLPTALPDALTNARDAVGLVPIVGRNFKEFVPK